MIKGLEIVLVEPEIPHNAGAAGRLSLALGVKLHLVRPLGFDLGEKAVRRAGLDYWKDVDLHVWEDWEMFVRGAEAKRLVLATTKATQAHWDFAFAEGDALVFGKETAGLSTEIRDDYPDHQIRIPMQPETTRSLNLATSIGIISYEAARQLSVG